MQMWQNATRTLGSQQYTSNACCSLWHLQIPTYTVKTVKNDWAKTSL